MGRGARSRGRGSGLGSWLAISLTVRETEIKLHRRWNYTPLCLSRIYPQASSSCFRECTHQGSFRHLFWECEKLQPTWCDVLGLMDKLAGRHMAFTHTHCLLFEKLPDTPKPLMNLIHIICIAVQWAIALHWKLTSVPLSQVLSRVDHIVLSEKKNITPCMTQSLNMIPNRTLGLHSDFKIDLSCYSCCILFSFCSVLDLHHKSWSNFRQHIAETYT